MIADPVPISALRKEFTVYVSVLKCASTFFHDNLLAQGWEVTDYYKIDWKNDFVFAHIIDPVVRRHKGLAEYIHMCGMAQQYLNSTNLQKLLNSCLILDQHSMPYSATFKDKLHDIFWIPLGSDHEKNVMITQDILNKKCQTNLRLKDWNFDSSHSTAADSDKKRVELRLQKKWQSSVYNHKKILDYFWTQLYHAIRDPAWPDAPAAQDFYNLPKHIQDEIATLHECEELKFVSVDSSWKLQLPSNSLSTNLITSAHESVLQEDIDLYNHVVETFSPP